MSNAFSVDARRMEEVAAECHVNAPKVVAVFEADVLDTLKKAAEVTNINNIRKIYENAVKLRDQAAVPIADSIKEVGKVLEEELEKHHKING